MAQNHVWRYTLRLFHTFALFEKIRKIDAKRWAKSHVDAERHRRTPWTLAVESKALESKKSADIGCTGAEKGENNMRKPSKYY